MLAPGLPDALSSWELSTCAVSHDDFEFHPYATEREMAF